MAKVKETKVALKGEKPKKAPKASETARKVPPQSEEIVVESDSDESSSGSSSGHSSGSESDAEKRKSTKKPKASKVKKTEPNSPPVPDDSSDDDSSSEDDSDSSDNKAKPKKTPAAVDTNGTALKTKGSSDESSSESESEDEESEEEQKPAEAQKVAGQADASEKTAAAIIPPQPFTAPPGYKPLDTKTANASTISSIFDSRSLSSKQVWHITAPSSVPLSDIKSVSLSAIQNHQPVLSHNGNDYNFTEEPSTNASVMIPSSKAEGYAAVNVPVTKILHLQQTVRLPNISSKQTNPVTGSNAAAKVNMPSNRGPRPQPKGLKMRYKPPGFGSGDPGIIGESDSEAGSDIDMADAPTTKPTPAASKRKRDEKDAAEASPRKDKKRRKAEEAAKKAEEKLAEGTKAEIPETAEEKERKKKERKEKKKKDKLK